MYTFNPLSRVYIRAFKGSFGTVSYWYFEPHDDTIPAMKIAKMKNE